MQSQQIIETSAPSNDPEKVNDALNELFRCYDSTLSGNRVTLSEFIHIKVRVLDLVKALKKDHFVFGLMCSVLTYYYSSVIMYDKSDSINYYTKINLLLNHIRLSPSFPKDCLRYSRLFLLLIHVDTSRCVFDFKQICHLPVLDHLSLTRTALEKYIQRSPFIDDSISMLAEFMFAYQHYLSPFSEMQLAKGINHKILDPYLDRAEFNKICKMARSRDKDKNTVDIQFYHLALDVFECIVNYYQEKKKSNDKRVLRGKNYVHNLQKFFDKTMQFFEKHTLDELSVAKQVLSPYASIGPNIRSTFLCYSFQLIHVTEAELSANADLKISETLAKEVSGERWLTLRSLLHLKAKMYGLKHFLQLQESKRSPIPAAQEAEALNSFYEMVKAQNVLTLMQIMEDQKKPIEDVLAEIEEDCDPYPVGVKTTKTEKITKSDVNKATTVTQADKPSIHKPLLTKPDTEQKALPNATPAINKIAVLLEQKKFMQVAEILHARRRKAESKKDDHALIPIYMSLGDLYLHWSQCKHGKKAIEVKLVFAHKYHQRCINAINTMTETELTHEPEYVQLKEFLSHKLKEYNDKIDLKRRLEPDFLELNRPKVEIGGAASIEEVGHTFKFADYVESISRKLITAGFSVWLTGGALRDYPGVPQDWDLVTNASIKEMQKVLGITAKVIGIRNPVIQINSFEKLVEISPLQASCVQKATEIESVEVATGGLTMLNRTNRLAMDAERRALTCNALFFDMGKRVIIDFYQSRDHIKHRIIQFIGDPDSSIKSDPTLILRIVRLMARYGYKISSAIEEAIFENADLLAKTNRARVNYELTKTMSIENTPEVLKLLKHFDILTAIFGYTEEENAITLQYLKRLVLNKDYAQDYTLKWAIIVSTRLRVNTEPQMTFLIHDQMRQLSQYGMSAEAQGRVATLLTIHILQINQCQQDVIKRDYTTADVNSASILTNIHNGYKREQSTAVSSTILAHGVFSGNPIVKSLKKLSTKSVTFSTEQLTVSMHLGSDNESWDEWMVQLLEVLKSVDSNLAHHREDHTLVLKFSTPEYHRQMTVTLEKYFENKSAITSSPFSK